MGQDRAQEIAGVPSCYPIGYSLDRKMGLGDFNKCSAEMLPTFNNLCDSLEVPDCLFNAGFK